MSKLHKWPTYSLLGAFTSTIAIFAIYAYVYVKQHPDAYTIKTEQTIAAVAGTKASDLTTADPWTVVYPNTKSMLIKDVLVQASIAKSWPERIKGLSDTPYLPETVVKLFIYDTPGFHSIWMKDMKYAIDIIWVNEAGEVVHTQENATPESYPDTFFEPKEEALYVIETAAGFVKKHTIVRGDTVELPL